MSVRTFWWIPLLVIGLAPRVEAQEKGVTRAIRDATVHTVSGATFRRGTVIWRDGKIVSVGRELEVPEDAETFGDGEIHVTPGLVAVLAQNIGLERTSGSVAHRLDPFDLELRIALANGITTAHLLGATAGGGFGQDAAPRGDSAVIRLTPGDLKSMLVKAPVVQFWTLPGSQLPRGLYDMRDRFRRAKRHLEALEEAKAKKAKPPRMDRDLGEYVQILRNERPTVVSVRNNHELGILIELRREYGFDVILYQPNDAWMLAPTLASEGIPVWVKSRGPDFQFALDQPVLEEGDMAPVRRPAAFARAGVRISILPYRRSVSLIGLAGRDLATLAIDAAFAVRGGMSSEKALHAITLEPARALGLDARIGSLEAGKDADLLIWSGPPLDYQSWVLQAFVGGKLVYDRATARTYQDIPLPSSPSSKASDPKE